MLVVVDKITTGGITRLAQYLLTWALCVGACVGAPSAVLGAGARRYCGVMAVHAGRPRTYLMCATCSGARVSSYGLEWAKGQSVGSPGVLVAVFAELAGQGQVRCQNTTAISLD